MEVSYVIPTLNSAKTLEMTLLGLSHQDGINITIKVVDSGSDDETLRICEKWGVEVLYAKPGNIYHAINVGLRTCSTDWVGYINSDDWIYPHSLEKLLKKAECDSADFVYGNCDFCDFAGRLMYSMGAAKPHSLLSIFRISGLGFAQQTIVFRRQCYQFLNGFDETFQLVGDKDFFARALLAKFKFSYLPGPPVAVFRLHSDQLSQARHHEMVLEGTRIRECLTGYPTFSDYLTWRTWQVSNVHQYLMRFIRQSDLAGKLIIRRSMSSNLS